MNENFLVNDFFRKVVKEPHYRSPSNNYLSPGYPAWNLLYYVFACVYKPNEYNIIIETGTCNGLSTIVMAQAIKDFGYKGKIYTMELDSKLVEKAKQHIEEVGLSEYIELINGESRKELALLLPKLPRLDFVFLDAEHTQTAVWEEFHLVKDLITKFKGYIYFDNTTSGGVFNAIQEIKRVYPNGNLIMFPNCSWSPPGQAIWSF